jgi:hypothetical protein
MKLFIQQFQSTEMYPIRRVPQMYSRIMHNPPNVRYKLLRIILIKSKDILFVPKIHLSVYLIYGSTVLCWTLAAFAVS